MCPPVLVEVRQGSDATLVVAMNPAFSDFVDRCCVEIVQLLPTLPDGRHEVGGLQDRQVLADGLTCHVQAFGELPKALPVASVQAIQQVTATRVCERLEHIDHDRPVARRQNFRSSGNGVPLPVSR